VITFFCSFFKRKHARYPKFKGAEFSVQTVKRKLTKPIT
jgi:hypothetical protein